MMIEFWISATTDKQICLESLKRLRLSNDQFYNWSFRISMQNNSVVIPLLAKFNHHLSSSYSRSLNTFELITLSTYKIYKYQQYSAMSSKQQFSIIRFSTYFCKKFQIAKSN
ncbi:hypothetical protein FGO68_gene12131 [Halteria grandinella]|uniref:Uncharacterized protein n=1 Tax=Halteria grandinella TaxID=5974 RepID=A0A8J8P639_HALGN|nr:hypothetical protein FGO68_gene12131 [Halteria grandinella]